MNILDGIKSRNSLVDTHTHLHSDCYKRHIPKYLNRAKEANVEEIWLVAVDYDSSIRNIEIIKQYQRAYPEVILRLGIGFDMEVVVPGSDIFTIQYFSLSATELEKKIKGLYEDIFARAREAEIRPALIGEIGMDFYHINNPDNDYELTRQDREHSIELQESLFRLQLQIAAENNLPVSIHSRSAEAECIEIVSEIQGTQANLAGIFHSFTGNAMQIHRITDLGFYIGINGIITYKSAERLRASVRRKIGVVDAHERTPDNGYNENAVRFSSNSEKEKSGALKKLYEKNIVLETDSPYLIPSQTKRESLKLAYGDYINDSTTILDTLQAVST